LKDYEQLIKYCGDNDNAKILLTHKRLLNMNKSFQYITLNKVYEDYFDGHFKNAFEYINTHYDVQLDYEKQACEFSDTNMQCIKERCTFYTGI